MISVLLFCLFEEKRTKWWQGEIVGENRNLNECILLKYILIVPTVLKIAVRIQCNNIQSKKAFHIIYCNHPAQPEKNI